MAIQNLNTNIVYVDIRNRITKYTENDPLVRSLDSTSKCATDFGL